VLELRPLLTSVVACLARAEALNRLRVDAAFPFHVAADELLLLSAPGNADAVASSAWAQLGDDALVVDQTDAFAGWTLRGDEALEAFCRLSTLSLGDERPITRQGLVAHVPAKILVANGSVHLLVPSTLSHHLSQRMRDVCVDLDLREADAAAFESAAVQEIAA
jgi:hypothetical protein